MSVKQRLIEFAKSQEKSVRAFEVKSGLTIGYINAIRQSISPDKVQCIASHYPNLNTGWIFTGEGEMLKKKEENNMNCFNEDHEIIKHLIESNKGLQRTIDSQLEMIECLQKNIDLLLNNQLK